MAYGLRYQMNFVDVLNNAIRIDFLLKDYEGELVESLTGVGGQEVEITRNLGAGGELEYIDTVEYAIQFYPTSAINLNLFRSLSNKKWKVEVYQNDVVLHYLWLINTDSRQPLNFRRGVPVTLKATDGLGLLKSEKIYDERVETVWLDTDTGDYVYNESAPTTPPDSDPKWQSEEVLMLLPKIGEISIIEALTLCLQKIGFELEIEVLCGFTTDWIELLIGNTAHPFELIKFYASVFEGKSVYDILFMLCENFNCVISQRNSKWIFWRPNELAYTDNTVYLFDASGAKIDSYPLDEIKTAGAKSQDKELFYVSDNHETDYFDPYKSVVATCNYGDPISLVSSDYTDPTTLITDITFGRVELDVIKEYGLYAYRFFRDTLLPSGHIKTPQIRLNPNDSLEIEVWFKKRDSNLNQFCMEIDVQEDSNIIIPDRHFLFSNALPNTEYPLVDKGFSLKSEYRWIESAVNIVTGTPFDLRDNSGNFYTNQGRYIVEQDGGRLTTNNFDYERLTFSVPKIDNYSFIGGQFTVKFFSTAAENAGNIEEDSSISYGGIIIRKVSERTEKSDNCRIETIENCDYSPAKIELQFLDDPLSQNAGHRIGQGSQYWKRTNRIENKALFEIITEDKYNLRMHNIPNISGDFMFSEDLPLFHRFSFSSFPNIKFFPWDVKLNLTTRVMSGMLVPIMDTDISHKVVFFYETSINKELVYLRKDVVVDDYDFAILDVENVKENTITSTVSVYNPNLYDIEYSANDTDYQSSSVFTGLLTTNTFYIRLVAHPSIKREFEKIDEMTYPTFDVTDVEIEDLGASLTATVLVDNPYSAELEYSLSESTGYQDSNVFEGLTSTDWFYVREKTNHANIDSFEKIESITPPSDVTITEPDKAAYYFSDGHEPSYYDDLSHLPAIHASGSTYDPDNDIVWLENAYIKIGVNLKRGGQIAYASRVGSSENLVNNGYDAGRQLQIDTYQNPDVYIQDGETAGAIGSGAPTSYNATMGGDYQFHSPTLIDYHPVANGYYIKIRPLMWPLTEKFSELFIEVIYTLEDNAVKIEYSYQSFRTDGQYTGTALRAAAVPAMFILADLDKYKYYNGSSPWTNDSGSMASGTLPNQDTVMTPPEAPKIIGAADASEKWIMVYSDADTDSCVALYNPTADDFKMKQLEVYGGPYDQYSTGFTYMDSIVLFSDLTDPTDYTKNMMCYVLIGTDTEIRSKIYEIHG